MRISKTNNSESRGLGESGDQNKINVFRGEDVSGSRCFGEEMFRGEN